jgi:hypothetical protein
MKFVHLKAFVLIGSCLFLSSAPQAQTVKNTEYVLPGTNVVFPASIDGFERLGTRNMTSIPGQAVLIQYERTNEWVASIVVVDSEGSKPPTSLSDPRIMRDRQHLAQSIVNDARPRESANKNGLSRMTKTEIRQVETPLGSWSVATDWFTVYIGDIATSDVAHTWIARGKIWQLRVTKMPNVTSSEAEFVEDVIRRSAGYDPKRNI